MDTFYIVMIVIVIVLVVAAVVLWGVEERANSQNRKSRQEKIVQRTVVINQEEDVYLRVSGGVLEVIESPAPQPEPAPVAAPAPEPEPEPVVEEVAVAEAAPGIELNEDSVVFQASQRLSFIEKYAQLTPEDRARFDELAAYVLAKPGCKRLESNDAITFKCK